VPEATLIVVLLLHIALATGATYFVLRKPRFTSRQRVILIIGICAIPLFGTLLPWFAGKSGGGGPGFPMAWHLGDGQGGDPRR
jgi:hypothetical protein